LVAIEQADTRTRQLGTKATTYCIHRCQFVHHSSWGTLPKNTLSVNCIAKWHWSNGVGLRPALPA